MNVDPVMKNAEMLQMGQAIGARRRKVYYDGRAAEAAGVAAPDGEDHEAADRGAGGRQSWPAPPVAPRQAASPDTPRGIDPDNERGLFLDLDG